MQEFSRFSHFWFGRLIFGCYIVQLCHVQGVTWKWNTFCVFIQSSHYTLLHISRLYLHKVMYILFQVSLNVCYRWFFLALAKTLLSCVEQVILFLEKSEKELSYCSTRLRTPIRNIELWFYILEKQWSATFALGATRQMKRRLMAVGEYKSETISRFTLEWYYSLSKSTTNSRSKVSTARSTIL